MTAAGTPQSEWAACRVCRLVQRLDRTADRGASVCHRCGAWLRGQGGWGPARAGWLALAGLVLYVPAMIFPFASVEYLGNYNQVSIAGAVRRIFALDQYLIGGFVLWAAVLAPAFQLAAWCVLGIRRGVGGAGRRAVYRLVKLTSPWSMSEVMLVSLLVGIVKFGSVTAVETGPGALAFALVVALIKAAQATFEPAAVWEEAYGR